MMDLFQRATNPVAFARNTLQFRPDEVQAEILSTTEPRILINCCRQWGKSTTTAALVAYTLWHMAGSLVLLLAPSARQSAEIFRKVLDFLRPLGIPIRGDGTNPVSLLLPNQARLIALPGGDATIRGFSAVSLLVLDEAARIPDETYFAVRPMLAANPNAVLCAVSTPHGQKGFFYEAWTNGGTLWQRFHVPATECPRLSPAFLAEEKFVLGDTRFRQEYLCEFLQPDDCCFPADLIDAAFTRDGKPL
ncbi:MAG: hypothetical protein IPM24_09765 [Bryobacterales bacterium]|nr:hypothetical protein [Bryobacterales bacterium]